MRVASKELRKLILEGTVAQRAYVFDKKFRFFAAYHFPEFFTYDIPEFHEEMYDDLDDLSKGLFHFLVWMMFRESAKSTIAKIYACYLGCTRKRHYINWDSFEKENAEQALFDIATWFQTKKTLINDYGQLYFKRPEAKQSTMRRIDAFILGNGVKYEAFSTQQSLRGRVYNQHRPDALFLDDIETNKTKRSPAITRQVIEHIDEAFSAMGPTAIIVLLCNYITESGTVQYVLEKAPDNPDMRVRRVDAEDKDGNPTWPEKYARDDFEAAVRNVEADPDAPVVSLEGKKRTLGPGVYATEMMNSPEASGDLLFDREKVKAAIELARKAKAPEDKAGFKVWAGREYVPSHRYAVGGDTSKGVGRDSCASVLGDLTAFPAEIVGTYANNRIAPDTFGDELKRQGDMFGTCLIGCEINNQGYATNTRLKAIYPIEKLYRRIQKGKTLRIDEKPREELGWETNGATKGTMVYEFKTAWEAGHILIWDPGLLDEMLRYNQGDLEELNPDPDSTRHFDKLMAACVWWQMRNQAEAAETASEHVPRAIATVSPFEEASSGHYDPFHDDIDQ